MHTVNGGYSDWANTIGREGPRNQTSGQVREGVADLVIRIQVSQQPSKAHCDEGKGHTLQNRQARGQRKQRHDQGLYQRSKADRH